VEANDEGAEVDGMTSNACQLLLRPDESLGSLPIQDHRTDMRAAGDGIHDSYFSPPLLRQMERGSRAQEAGWSAHTMDTLGRGGNYRPDEGALPNSQRDIVMQQDKVCFFLSE
jgi:hypothetical protein